MSKQPRLDAPGALHHVVGRGIDGIKIVSNSKDREGFLERLRDLCGADALSVYAWALMSQTAVRKRVILVRMSHAFLL